MRLHRLTLRGIGPFVAETEIDFARLGESGLFLLEGPTGSGKSTIIDAVSFALYGRVAQASASTERLHSHHAASAGDSWVELVFETQSGIYRIRRTPTFERPKRSGDGVRKVNATVKIWRLTSPDAAVESEPLSTRVSEADDEVTRAVGLTHDQFVQTVVLPQGEFANFLRSKTDDKKALLQRLFGTEVIAATQLRLIEGRRAAEQQRAAAELEVRKALQAFVGAARVDESASAELDAAAAAPGAGDDLMLVVDRVVAERVDLADRTAQAHAASTAQLKQASEALQAARDLLRRQRRRAELAGTRAALAEQQPQHDHDRRRLDEGQRAARVLSPASALAAAIKHSDTAQDELKTARAALPAQDRTADMPALRETAADAQTLLGSLADAVQREGQLDRLLREHQTLDRQRQGLEATISSAQLARSAVPARIEQLDELHALATSTAAREASLLAEYQRAEQRLAAAEQAELAATSLAQEAQITQEAVAAWDAQNERLVVLRRSWRAGVAGELGVSLVDGDPCAVCGSVEHPAPARPRSDHVSQQALEAGEAESRRLQLAVEKARAEHARQRAELESLQIRADSLTPMQARSTLNDAAVNLAEAREAREQRDRISTEIVAARADYDELGSAVADAESEHAALTARAEALAARIAEDNAILDQARAGHRTVRARVELVRSELAALVHAADAVHKASEAVQHALDCGERFRDALNAAGFADEAHWQAALITEPELAALGDSVEEFDRRWAAVCARLADPELTDPALDAPEPDLKPLEDGLLVAETTAAEQGSLAGATRERLADTRRRATAVERALRANANLLTSTAAAIRMGNLAAGVGDNQLRMDLTTFVLIRRFADVVSAANGQLRRVSGGRYELEHTDAKAGNARSGLGLRVLDLHTGKPRDPATLSGGETFYVSLALALGLADVVRAESGGIELATLFIDEGFGSLDPQVLDEVLGVLDSLRAGGRAVGVVSHVADLKSRIPERITVRRSDDGTSRITVVA